MNRYTLLPLGLMILAVAAEPIEADETSTTDQRILVSRVNVDGHEVDYFRQLLAPDGESQKSPCALRIVLESKGATIESTADMCYSRRFVDLAADADTHSLPSADLFDTITTNGAAIEITTDAIHIRGGNVEIRRGVSPK